MIVYSIRKPLFSREKLACPIFAPISSNGLPNGHDYLRCC